MYKNILKRIVRWESKTEEQKAHLKNIAEKCWRLAFSVFPVPLDYILQASGSDKHQKGGHLYGVTYNTLFKRFRYRRIKLLEIGIGGYAHDIGGSSLKAWETYFPFARIVGCDIVDKKRLETRRIRTYALDQYSAADLSVLCRAEGTFDIIIDDGSHMSKHQIFTFEKLFPSLNDEGLYVVEDIQTSYWKSDGWDGADVGSPAFDQTCFGYFLSLAKYINHAEFEDVENVDSGAMNLAKSIRQMIFEHNLIIIVKGDNTNFSNRWPVGRQDARRAFQ